MSSRGAYRDHPPQLRLQLCQAIRSGRSVFAMRRECTACRVTSSSSGWAHAQLAMTAGNAEELRYSLHAVIEGVGRASHQLSHLLDMASVETLFTEGTPRFQLVDRCASVPMLWRMARRRRFGRTFSSARTCS